MTITDPRVVGLDFLDRLRDLVDQHETWRGRETINLNAANNVLSATARRMLSTRLADKGISGGLGRRHHMGGGHIDKIETIVVELGTRLFGAPYVEYRPSSGSIANALAIAALVDADATLMVLGEGAPGHQSYRRDGWGGRLAGRVVDLPFDYARMDLDTADLQRQVEDARPRLIILGSALLLFPYDLAPIRQAAESVGALIMYDGAHVMGLFAGGVFQDPLSEGADLVTGSTQKSLPGPIGGLILTRSMELGERIFDVSTRLVSNYENNRILALGVALAEMLAFGKDYAAACIANAQALAANLAERGFKPLGADRGFTRSNQVILDVSGFGSGNTLSEQWERANIITTAIYLPSPRPTSGRDPDGIRLGVQELTRLGMRAQEMREVADLMLRAAQSSGSELVATSATHLVRSFPTVYYTFDHPTPP